MPRKLDIYYLLKKNYRKIFLETYSLSSIFGLKNGESEESFQ